MNPTAEQVKEVAYQMSEVANKVGDTIENIGLKYKTIGFTSFFAVASIGCLAASVSIAYFKPESAEISKYLIYTSIVFSTLVLFGMISINFFNYINKKSDFDYALKIAQAKFGLIESAVSKEFTPPSSDKSNVTCS